MTKVLYVIDSLPFGGAERQLSLLLKYLPPAWQRRVVSLGGGPYQQVLLDQGTSTAVYQRRSRFDLAPVFRLHSEIFRYKPDIIHSWGGLCSALAAPISRLLRIPFIDGSIRIANPAARHAWRRTITFMLSDRIVANSHAGLSAYGVTRKKGSVIYNAMDPDRFQWVHQRMSESGAPTTVVMTARISPYKDFALFFQAARCLHAQEPGQWRFIAIGAGAADERKKLGLLAEDLLTAGVVEMPDAGLEVLPYLQEANIGVLLSVPSFKEGLSNSIMEYMASALPVVCSDSGGNRELVSDGETGFVVQAGDLDSLLSMLLFLKRHPALAEKMGQAGHARVMELCMIGRMIRDYEMLYSGLLGHRSGESRTDRSFREFHGVGHS